MQTFIDSRSKTFSHWLNSKISLNLVKSNLRHSFQVSTAMFVTSFWPSNRKVLALLPVCKWGRCDAACDAGNDAKVTDVALITRSQLGQTRRNHKKQELSVLRSRLAGQEWLVCVIGKCAFFRPSTVCVWSPHWLVEIVCFFVSF